MTPALSYLIPLFTVFPAARAQQHAHRARHQPPRHHGADRHVRADRLLRIAAARGSRKAAQIDGASVWTAFRYVAVPLARPGITVACILAFIFSWNNFVFAAVLGKSHHTHVACGRLQRADVRATGLGDRLPRRAIVVTVPVLLLTIFIQKEIVAGLTAGRREGIRVHAPRIR